METVFLGKTGVRVSRLAFGTMSFGGDADEHTSAALFGRCRDAGVNLFDCADVYAGGRSEEILGGLIAPCRDEIVLTTKAYFPTSAGPNARGSSRYHLVRAVEASLRRLGTDRIDLFFLHRHDDFTDTEETLRAVDDLVRQGKILYVGASNFAAWQVARGLGVQAARGLAPFSCVQPMYNLLKRQAEVEILPHAHAESLGVFPYSPLAGGLLSGRYGRERRPESGRLVSNAMYQVRYGDPACWDAAERFTDLARAWGHHPAALAIAWVASHPAVTAPLLGARSVEQLDAALGAADIRLSPEQRAEIGALTTEPPPATDRNEERSAHNYGSR